MRNEPKRSGPARVSVDKPTHGGVRVDHPVLLEYMRNGFKLGWGNEQVCRVTGLPISVVSEHRNRYEKEKKTKQT